MYRPFLINGKYTDVENLGPVINTKEEEGDLFIVPDESFLVFCSIKPGGYGREDLNVTFRNRDGSWTKPINLGGDFNSSTMENPTYITSDGKCFFFISGKSGNRNIYWVNAKINLKPKDLM